MRTAIGLLQNLAPFYNYRARRNQIQGLHITFIQSCLALLLFCLTLRSKVNFIYFVHFTGDEKTKIANGEALVYLHVSSSQLTSSSASHARMNFDEPSIIPMHPQTPLHTLHYTLESACPDPQQPLFLPHTQISRIRSNLSLPQ